MAGIRDFFCEIPHVANKIRGGSREEAGSAVYMKTHSMKKKMTAAYHYSLIRLAFNYFTFYDSMAETGSFPKGFDQSFDAFNECLKNYFAGKAILSALNLLRERIKKDAGLRMHILDYYSAYDGVLKRLMGRFKTMPEPNYYEKELAKLALKYATKTFDGNVSSARASEIINCLPIRLTRQKLYEYLAEGLSLYVDRPLKELTSILSKMRELMIPFPNKELKKGRPDLYEELERFEHLDYGNLTPQAYESAKETLSSGKTALFDELDLICSLQEMINDLYVMVLTIDDVTVHGGEEAYCHTIIKTLLHDECINAKEPDVLLPQLMMLEGAQEAYGERFLQLENPPETPELRKDPDYARMQNIDLLYSGSQFVDLKGIFEGTAEEASLEIRKVDRQYLDKREEELFRELEERFHGASSLVVRIIMIKLLSSLPHFLSSGIKLHLFVLGTLEACDDKLEKTVCMLQLEDVILEDEGMSDVLIHHLDHMDDYEN